MGHGRNGAALAEMRQKKLVDQQRRDAIKNLQSEIPYFKKKLELKKKDFEITKQVQEKILKNFGKIEPTYVYEKDKDYQDLLEKKQAILNDIYYLDVQHEIDMMEHKLKEMEEQLVELKEQVKFVEGDGNE